MPVMDGEYYRPTYKVPTYRPPTTYKKTYTPQYREEPYDNTGAMRAAEQARLIREAQQRQAAQLAAQRQAEMQRLAAQQRQAAIDRAAQSRQSLQAYNPMATPQPKAGSNSFWNNISQGLANASLAVTNPLRQAFGFPMTESWQRPGVGTPRHTYNDYDRAGNYEGGNYPWLKQGYYDANTQPGWAEDWGMMQSGAIANRFGGGQLDRANWGRGVPSWDEVLKYADPNAHDPYDVAGNPYFTAEDMPIEDYYGGGYGGGGSYSSKPGYYGQSSNYGNRYYENLLQWNI